MSGQAQDVNKQTIYTAPKSTHESSAQYSPEPARGVPVTFQLPRRGTSASCLQNNSCSLAVDGITVGRARP